MPLLVWILIFTTLGGILSVMAAAMFLALPQVMRARLLPGAVSFAVGALLGAAFLALIPRALESPGIDGGHGITATVLFGLLGFFVLEKLVIWRHCHIDECEAHGIAAGMDEPAAGTAARHAHDPAQGRATAAGQLILIGDGIHNLVDGVLIGAAFLTDVYLGIVTSMAVVAHEIPQEVGDFAILLHSGFSRTKALAYNVLASLTTVVGGVAAYFALSQVMELLPYVLAIAASSFIYIAVADLIPGLHERVEGRAGVQQVALIALGVAFIFIAHSTLH